MHCDHLHTIIPLERYREIISALRVDRELWAEDFWMRIAAQAAVLCPDSPDDIALRIRHIASALRAHTDWYQSLASSARFAVAAMLIQHHIPVSDFLGECGRASDIFHDVGLRHGGFSETMAVLIMRLSPGHRSFTIIEAERIKAIYDQLKRFHWWLTGPHDLPACAALAQCPGPAEVVVARTEAAFQDLYGGNLAKGRHLQTAAQMLAVTGLPIETAVSRYRTLKSDLEARIGMLADEQYEALGALTMLNHPSERIVDRLCSVQRELDLFQAERVGTTNLLIAADLAFLDLVRFGSDMEPVRTASEAAILLRSLHVFHILSAILISQIEPEVILPISMLGAQGWPYPYG